MMLNRNRNGKFLVLTERKVDAMGDGNRVFIPDGEKAEGWWQMMEALHEVVGVTLVPPEWVMKKSLVSKSDAVIVMEQLVNVFRCWDYKNVVEAKMVKRYGALFTNVLARSEQGENRVRKEGRSDLSGVGRVNLKIENRIGGDHMRDVWQDDPIRNVRNGPKPVNVFGLKGKRRLLWVEKGKWVDQAVPSRKLGQKRVQF